MMNDDCTAVPAGEERNMAKAEGLDNPSIKDANEVARALGTDLEHGLTSAEAARRLAAEGPNELRSAPPGPIWRRVLGAVPGAGPRARAHLGRSCAPAGGRGPERAPLGAAGPYLAAGAGAVPGSDHLPP